MGIKNLKKLIKRFAPDAIHDRPDLYNKKIAIDSSILLYKFRYTYKDDSFHIRGFLHKVIEYLEAGVIPIFVFDGKPPDAKKLTLDKRIDTRSKMQEKIQELTVLRNTLINNQPPSDFVIDPDEYINSDEDDDNENEIVKEIKKINTQIRNIEKNILVVKRIHSDEVMDFLKSLGIPFLKADGESEETCAFLQKNGFVDYVMSEDTDSLTFGASSVIFGDKLYVLENILTALEIDYNSFIDLCILCGCDYTRTVPKIGPINALRLIKLHKTIENLNVTLPPDFDYVTSRRLFTQNQGYVVPGSPFTFGNFDVNAVQCIFEKHFKDDNLYFFLEKIKILLSNK